MIQPIPSPDLVRSILEPTTSLRATCLKFRAKSAPPYITELTSQVVAPLGSRKPKPSLQLAVIVDDINMRLLGSVGIAVLNGEPAVPVDSIPSGSLLSQPHPP